MRIGLLSDTHIPEIEKALPPQVMEAFTSCGLMIERIMKEKVWVAALLVSLEGNE